MPIRRQADVLTIRKRAKDLALSIGFDETVSEEIVIAISELATNLIKYGILGSLAIYKYEEDGRVGVLIEARDKGPGFDESKAMIDGYSSSHTLGNGLGAVNRLMDELSISANEEPSGGTLILCKKWLPQKRITTEKCPYETGVVTRSKPGMNVNGDAYLFKVGNGFLLAALIDGVGHGQQAFKAAQTARIYVDNHWGSSLPLLFQGVDRACRSTQGVVMAIALFDYTEQVLTLGNVGNIEAKIFGTEEKLNFLVRRGILGKGSPAPSITRHRWNAEYGLILHTDGLSSHWTFRDFPEIRDKPPQTIAEHLHRRLEKGHDDATLMVVK